MVIKIYKSIVYIFLFVFLSKGYSQNRIEGDYCRDIPGGEEKLLLMSNNIVKLKVFSVKLLKEVEYKGTWIVNSDTLYLNFLNSKHYYLIKNNVLNYSLEPVKGFHQSIFKQTVSRLKGGEIEYVWLYKKGKVNYFRYNKGVVIESGRIKLKIFSPPQGVTQSISW